jgi:hypothetical protein
MHHFQQMLMLMTVAVHGLWQLKYRDNSSKQKAQFVVLMQVKASARGWFRKEIYQHNLREVDGTIHNLVSRLEPNTLWKEEGEMSTVIRTQ